MMRPRAVAIIGMSARPGAPGHTVLAHLPANGFAGPIHLVGRSAGEIDGRPVLAGVDDLPEGVDLAIFVLPAAAVREAVAGCVRRKVGAAVIFAAGFSELNSEGAAEQEAITAMAREGGLALLGPNCLGYTNFVDGIAVGIFGGTAIRRVDPTARPTLAVIGQSGGLVGHLRGALEARPLAVSHTITTGNEAGLGIADFIDHFADDAGVRAIVLYAENIRRPDAFLAASAKARANGRPVIMLHPGRGARAKEAARSHTGALAGDYAVMHTLAEHAGVVMVETLEELVDVAEILARFPIPPTKGVGIVTFSGAFCGIAYDFCEDVGLDIPPLSPETAAALRPQLPAFAPPNNPLDLTTQPAWQPELLGIGAKAVLDDPAIGSLVIAITVGAAPIALSYLDGLLPQVEGIAKPMTFIAMGDGAPLLPEFVQRLNASPMIFGRSTERALRAMARVTAYGRRTAAAQPVARPAAFPSVPALGSGTLPEWRGKEVLAAIGIRVPGGALAHSADEATAVAGRIGYPVVAKAQAAALAHKTEAGGVIVGIGDEAALRRAWEDLHARVARAQPGLTLDGVLVEAMAAPGLELMVGARRDPLWGPVVLAGLGGIWVEALGDVRLMPADLPEDQIAAELQKLKTAKLLNGFRGAPPTDVAAVAAIVARIGRLMLTQPEIVEIDVNPLIAYGRGDGAIALDALIVTR